MDQLQQTVSRDDFYAMLDIAIRARLINVHTALPAIVQSFDAETQLATVRPAIQRNFNGEFVTISDLLEVPVVFPKAGGFSQTYPVQTGDEVQLIFNERSIDNWLNNGGVSEPNNKNLFDLSDAVAMLGLYAQPNKITSFNDTDAEWRNDDGDTKIRLAQDEIEISTAGGDNQILVQEDGTMTITNPQASVIIDPAGTISIDGVAINITGSQSIDLTAPNININAATALAIVSAAIGLQGATNVVGATTMTALAVTGPMTQGGVDIGAAHTHSGVESGPDTSGPVVP